MKPMGKKPENVKGLLKNAESQKLHEQKRLSKGVYKSSSQGPK